MNRIFFFFSLFLLFREFHPETHSLEICESRGIPHLFFFEIVRIHRSRRKAAQLNGRLVRAIGLSFLMKPVIVVIWVDSDRVRPLSFFSRFLSLFSRFAYLCTFIRRLGVCISRMDDFFRFKFIFFKFIEETSFQLLEYWQCTVVDVGVWSWPFTKANAARIATSLFGVCLPSFLISVCARYLFVDLGGDSRTWPSPCLREFGWGSVSLLWCLDSSYCSVGLSSLMIWADSPSGYGL